MKINLLENRNFQKGHPEYRMAYMVNAAFLILSLITFMFVLFNLMVLQNLPIFVINSLASILSFLTYLRLKNGKNVAFYAKIALGLITTVMLAYFLTAGSKNYSLVWLCVYQPAAYFLLGRKKARTLTFIFNVLILGFLFLLHRDFPSDHILTSRSLANITGAIFCIVLMIGTYEDIQAEKSEELALILDSTDNGIIRINPEGRCTFSNRAAAHMLGFENEEDILGMDMEDFLNISLEKDVVSPREKLFSRKDKSSFYAEYSIKTHRANFELTGYVLTLRDITEKKAHLDKIEYLSTHDALTGLYNRHGFDNMVTELEKSEVFPVTVIFCDVNNLKLVNDIFGHGAGDKLLLEFSNMIREIFNDADVLARIGGDEFVVLLTGARKYDVENRIRLVRERISEKNSFSLPCGMAIGYDVKTNIYQSMESILGNAETYMYRDKTKTRDVMDMKSLDEIMAKLHEKSERERVHSENVSNLCREIARMLDLPAKEVEKASRAGYYHDIGKIILPDDILITRRRKKERDRKIYFRHPVAGYKILTMAEGTMDLAESVYLHHERWDGTGYPKGIKGEEIPLLSRIIAVGEAYDEVTNPIQKNPLSPMEALDKLRDDPGKLDPYIVNMFIRSRKGELS